MRIYSLQIFEQLSSVHHQAKSGEKERTGKRRQSEKRTEISFCTQAMIHTEETKIQDEEDPNL